MSGQVITELFQQIVHSEEKIKERFEQLKKVNQGIQDHQSQIKSIKYEREALLGKLNNLRHKLLEEELEKKWLTIRKGILEEQQEKVTKEKGEVQKELKELEEKQKKDSSLFLKECDQFLNQYNVLEGDEMLRKREDKMKEELNELQKEKQTLEADMHKSEDLKSRRNILDEDVKCLEKEIEEIEGKNEEMTKQQVSVADEMKKLKEMKGSFTNKSKQQNIINLQNRLERCRKEAQFLNNEKRDLEKEVQRKKMNTNRLSNQQTKPANPWYVSRPTGNPGFSNHSSSNVKRFQYKTPNNNDRLRQNESHHIPRKRNADEMCLEDNFDFDVNLDDDDDSFMASYVAQKQ